MAKSCGIHVDQRSVHLVALDGNAKKHKLAAHLTCELDPHDEPGEALVTFLRGAAKELKLSRENVGLVVDSGPASFRTLTLPFDDHAKIEEVLKFEVESDLPQWDIDEVVTDFLVTDAKPGVASDLLVTAMPKDRLATRLQACERAGLEADEAELDGTALFNAALDSGALGEESAHILVHVGDASTTVVVVDGGKLASIRAIRVGAFPVRAPFQASEDEDEDEENVAPEADPAEEQRRLEESAKRIRREIVRTISAARLENELEAVLLSGHPLPGFDESGIFEVPVVALRVLPGGSDRPVPADAVVAYGSALRALGGGVLRPHLRREELRFTGTFERLELPLAVLCLLGFFLLLVVFVVTDTKLKWKDVGDPKNEIAGNMQIWIQASNGYMLPNPKGGYAGRLENPPEAIANYARRMQRGEITDRSNYDQLGVLNRMLTAEIDKLERDLGQKSEVAQPQSALHASTLVMQALESLGDQAPRFGVRRLEASYVRARTGGSDYVTVKMDIDFLAQDDLTATQHYSNFANEVQAQPWCNEFERKPTKVLDSGKGIYIDGLTIEVDLSKIEEEGQA